MKNMMREIGSQKMVTVYSEDLDDEYISGFISCSNEDTMVLACVDRFGENNGFLLIGLDGVYRMDVDSAYEKKLELLYTIKKQQHDPIDFSQEETIKETLIRWAYRENKTITVGFWNTDSEVCGYIENPDNVKIINIDEYECKPGQGTSFVEVENVKYIWADERRARDAALVYKLREKEC